MIVPLVTVGALFCEDIREEMSGALTLVGVFPDNLAVPTPPIILPKFAVFVRIAISIAGYMSGSELVIRLESPNGETVITHLIEAPLIEKTVADARSQDSMMATFFTRLTAAPFPIAAYGRFQAILDYGNDSYFAGSINFVQ